MQPPNSPECYPGPTVRHQTWLVASDGPLNTTSRVPTPHGAVAPAMIVHSFSDEVIDPSVSSSGIVFSCGGAGPSSSAGAGPPGGAGPSSVARMSSKFSPSVAALPVTESLRRSSPRPPARTAPRGRSESDRGSELASRLDGGAGGGGGAVVESAGRSPPRLLGGESTDFMAWLASDAGPKRGRVSPASSAVVETAAGGAGRAADARTGVFEAANGASTSAGATVGVTEQFSDNDGSFTKEQADQLAPGESRNSDVHKMSDLIGGGVSSIVPVLPSASPATSSSLSTPSTSTATPAFGGSKGWAKVAKVHRTVGLSQRRRRFEVVQVLGTEQLAGKFNMIIRKAGTLATFFTFALLIYLILVYGVKLYDNVGPKAPTRFLSTWLFFLLLKTCFLDWFPAVLRAIKQELMKFVLMSINLKVDPYLWFEQFDDEKMGRSMTSQLANEAQLDAGDDDGGVDGGADFD